MRKLPLLIPTLAFTLFVNAQSLTPSVISSTGGFSANANGSLSYTVGEMTMVQTFSASGNILTQGFQQPTDKVTGLIDISKTQFGSFVIYPNPAVDNLWFGLQLPEEGKVQIALYNAIGQKLSDVFSSEYESGKMVQQIDLASYSAGTYLLSMNFISDKDGHTYTTSKKFQVIY